jgi:hypothetical protein
MTASGAGREKKAPAPAAPPLPAAKTAAQEPAAAPAADTALSFDAAFMDKYGKPATDSLVAMVKNDYSVCVGDPERVGRTQLFRWKSYIDSMVADKGYPKKFKSFVTATGMKAPDVRPCEPIVFHDHIERQLAEMDNIVAAQRAAKEKAHSDSVTIATELKKHKHSHADILNLPPGISKAALRLMLEREKIRYKSVQKYIQADDVMLDSVMVTIAFYFDENDKYNGYEFETETVRAETLDKTARKWADRFAAFYEKKFGKPANAVNRVGFKEIKQGSLSITSKWDSPSVIVGLAVYESRYYAKVMVNY